MQVKENIGYFLLRRKPLKEGLCSLEVGRYHLADIDTISIFVTQNIGNIYILYCSAL